MSGGQAQLGEMESFILWFESEQQRDPATMGGSTCIKMNRGFLPD